MRRREFITLLGGAAAAWPVRVGAAVGDAGGRFSQRRLGGTSARSATFRKGLTKHGYVEGQNVEIEDRWAEDHYDLLPKLAATVPTPCYTPLPRCSATMSACSRPKPRRSASRSYSARR